MRISVIIAVVLVVIGVVASLGVTGVAEYQRASEIDIQIAALQAEAEILERKNALLEDRIAYFASSAYKEYVAKERLGYVRDGEQVVSVAPAVLGVNTKNSNNTRYDKDNQNNTQQSEDKKPKSWWQAIFGN